MPSYSIASAISGLVRLFCDYWMRIFVLPLWKFLCNNLPNHRSNVLWWLYQTRKSTLFFITFCVACRSWWQLDSVGAASSTAILGSTLIILAKINTQNWQYCAQRVRWAIRSRGNCQLCCPSHDCRGSEFRSIYSEIFHSRGMCVFFS